MKKLLGALAVCFLMATTAFGQINENFSGFAIGGADFTLTDPNDPGFSATFGAPGEAGFFNDGSLYIGSNRAFVVDGGNTSSIQFNTLADISISGRDTNGELTGGASVTVPGGVALGSAIGTAEAFDASNNSLGVFNFTEGAFSSFTFDGVDRLDISNTGPVGSFALLGQITAQATAVPEPCSSTLLCGLAGVAFLRRRRN